MAVFLDHPAVFGCWEPYGTRDGHGQKTRVVDSVGIRVGMNHGASRHDLHTWGPSRPVLDDARPSTSGVDQGWPLTLLWGQILPPKTKGTRPIWGSETKTICWNINDTYIQKKNRSSNIGKKTSQPVLTNIIQSTTLECVVQSSCLHEDVRTWTWTADLETQQ